MAVVARVFVRPSDQALHDSIQDAVNAGIAAAGGPPEGLMAHVSLPSGDGFEIVEVWRSEDTWSTYWAEILGPAITGAGLHPDAPEVVSAWGFARP
jgi:hypothetical protein